MSIWDGKKEQLGGGVDHHYHSVFTYLIEGSEQPPGEDCQGNEAPLGHHDCDARIVPSEERRRNAETNYGSVEESHARKRCPVSDDYYLLLCFFGDSSRA